MNSLKTCLVSATYFFHQEISMTKNSRLFTLFVICLLALLGCQNAPVSPATSVPSLAPAPTFDASAVTFPTIEPPTNGQGTVTGHIISKETGQPIYLVGVQLAEVHRGEGGEDGIFILDLAQSPYTETDELGWFALNNIPPGEYVLVVGWVEAEDYYIAQDEAGKPMVWTAVANSVVSVGEIRSDRIDYVITRDTFTPEPEGAYPAPDTQAYP